MLTNEKVLEIFKDYIDADKALDVISTRRGYAVMLWDFAHRDWSDVVCCQTPEALFDKLLDSYALYQEFLMIRDKSDSEGEISETERAQIQKMCLPYLEKRKEAETK